MSAIEMNAGEKTIGTYHRIRRDSLLHLILAAFIFLFAVMFFLTVIFLAGSDAFAGYPWVREEKSISRDADSVVIPGRKIIHNLHQPISRLALFSSVEGEIRPIPFQIDEIDPEGEWVLPSIPPGLAGTGITPEQDDDNGCLDENDELAFMIRDSGDRIRPEYYPRGAVSVDEISLTDPVSGEKAWVYLCGFSSDAPRADGDYVEYVFPENLVKSVDFTVGFSPGTAFCPGSMSLWGSKNIVDRMKIRFHLKTFGLNYYLDETKLDSSLSLYKDGPVRVIRRVNNAIKITNTLKTPSAAIENVYYDNAIALPMRIQIPISPRILKALVSTITLSGSVDMQNIHGWRVKADSDPNWLTVNGRMDYLEANLTTDDATWFLLDGPRGALLYRIVLDRRPDGTPYEQPITTSLLYVDDDQALDPPENIPGQSPNVGFWIRNLEDISKGMLYFYTVMFMIKDYEEGMENEYLKIFDHPMEVRVN